MAASEFVPDDANPYSVISDRNVFHLNAAPIPPAADAPKPVDLPKVMLTGFVGKGKSMKVLMAIPPAKDSKDTITYLSLAPGDREHDVQLVRIHLDKEEVEIINSGTAQTLSAKSNSYAAMAATSHSEGGPRGEKGVPGLHRPMNPGFTPPGFTPPAAPGPMSSATQGGGSALIIGGGGGSGSQFGGSSGGSFVSGGASSGGAGGAAYGQYNPTGVGATGNTGNNVGSQIASALFNPQTGHYQPPVATGPGLPADVQRPIMVLQKAAMNGGGPPLPPTVQAEVDAANGQEPPPGGGGGPNE